MGRLSIWLLAAGLLLLLGGSLSLVSLLKPGWTSAWVDTEDLPAGGPPTRTPFQSDHQTPTLTPFQPLIQTLTPSRGPQVEWIPALYNQVPVLQPAATPQPHFAHRLLDFPQEKIRLRIFPDQLVNGGKMIKMTFYPAPDCAFGSGRSCVSVHRNGQVILLTIHSGVGGEGEAFRLAVEGLSLDQAGFSIGRIQANLADMQNAPVQLNLGPDNLGDFELAALARIPPLDLQRFFDLPFDDALERVASQNEPLRSALDSGEPLLAFETCGWQMPGEAWGEGSTATSASIYLGFIRRKS